MPLPGAGQRPRQHDNTTVTEGLWAQMYPAQTVVVHLLKVTIAAALTIIQPAPATPGQAAREVPRLGVTATLGRPHLVTARRLYVVRAGDNLTDISRHQCHADNDWTGIYAANRRQVGRNPNEIRIGTALAISCTQHRNLLHLAADYAPRPVYRHAVYPGHSVSYYQARPAGGYRTGRHHYYRQAASTSSGYSSTRPSAGYGSPGTFESCVIARESGGNSQVMNSSGHYGLYQFSEATWVAYGGAPGDFGHASAAEQHQVFSNAIAQGGQSNWSPYDGC
jgi:Transglycosylase-like domain/LysM domain